MRDARPKNKTFVFEPAKMTGFQSPAENRREPEINLHEYIVKYPAATYLMWAKGDKLFPEIFEGDLLVVVRGIKPVKDSIVICSINRCEFQLRRFSEINLKPETELEIAGVVTHVVRRLATPKSN